MHRDGYKDRKGSNLKKAGVSFIAFLGMPFNVADVWLTHGGAGTDLLQPCFGLGKLSGGR